MRLMTSVSTSIALGTFLLMSNGAMAATCDASAAPAAPTIPADGERNVASMLSAQASVKSYVSASKEHLKCVRSSSKHNALVDQIYAVADEYNTALKEFRASTR